MKGTLHLSGGRTCLVSGVVLRYVPERNQCALTLSVGVPMARLLEELQRLSARGDALARD